MSKGIVLHSDGSARPNPGFAGWGIHGYIYDDAEPTKGTGNPDYVLTADDYVTKAAKAADESIKAVTPLKYIDAFGSFDQEQTNNYAELAGMIAAMQIVLDDPEIVKATIWTDSKEYVLRNIGGAPAWRANGWLKNDGHPPKNVELWKELLEKQEELKARGVVYSLKWVKGHSGVLGNETADVLAYIGMRHSTHRKAVKEVTFSEPQGYWKYESNRHPLFHHRRMYFNSQPEYLSAGEYYFGEHDKDDDMVGKRMAHGAYALVRMKEPDPVLEVVRQHACEMAETRNTLMMTRLDYLYRADIHEQVSKWGGIPLVQPNKQRLDTQGYDENPLSKELYPPMIAQRAIDAIQSLGIVLEDFLQKKEHLLVTDLTAIIYETIVETKKTGEKITTKLRPEFKVGTSKLSVNVAYRRPNGENDTANIDLTLGLDMIDRNALRRLEEDSPTVHLVTWPEEPQAFRYATIIQTKDGMGVYASHYANLKIILPKAA